MANVAHALRRAAGAALGIVGMLLFAAGAAAQRRAPLFGVVRDAAGAPIEGAAVTVVEDDPHMVGIERIDVLEATTDARGRFKVDALCGVRYAAFAVGPERDGRALVAPPVRGLACARPAELTADVEGRRRTEPVSDLAAWGEFAELRVALAVSWCLGPEVALAIDDGSLTVPPLADIGTLVLRDRTGAYLTELLPPRGDYWSAEVQAPVALAVVVVDANGEPVEGARVRAQQERGAGSSPWSYRCHTRLIGPVARTDAQGRASVRSITFDDPFESPPNDLVVAAIGADGREGVAGWVSHEPFADWKIAAHRSRTLRITLSDAPPVVAKAAGAGVADGPARAFALQIADRRNRGMVEGWYVRRGLDFTIGADGAFALPLSTRHTRDVVVRTPRVDGKRVFWLPGRGGALPNLDLATCRPFQATLVDATGGPAVAAEVLLVPADCTEHDLDHAVPLVPDPAGRIDVLLQRGAWVLLAADATHWAAAEIDGAGGPLTLKLEPKPSMRVRVVDADGAPVAGARFGPGDCGTPQMRVAGIPTVLAALGWNGFARDVRAAVADANGYATLCRLPQTVRRPRVFAFAGDHSRRSDDFHVVDDGSGEPTVIELRR